MFPKHAWSCVTHDRLGLIPALRSVAVNRTISAGWLVLAEAAAFQAHRSIIDQPLTLRTKLAVAAMLVGAVDVCHGYKGLVLTTQTAVRQGGGRGSRLDRGRSDMRFIHHASSMP